MIEELIAANTAALIENTAALREVLAAGGAAPTNVVPIAETPKPAGKKTPAKAEPKPEPAAEEPVETERPTKVEVTEKAAEEFSDPLDKDTTVVIKGDPAPPKIDVDATIKECVDGFKAKMVEAADDAERKAFLKDQFEALRKKWDLAPGAKLITLAPTPEKLVGLLEDIKAL